MIELTPADECAKSDIGFSMGNLTKGSLDHTSAFTDTIKQRYNARKDDDAGDRLARPVIHSSSLSPSYRSSKRPICGGIALVLVPRSHDGVQKLQRRQ